VNARAVALWSLAALTVALLTTNPVYRALVALVAANVLLRQLPTGRSLRPLAIGLAAAAGFSVLLNLLLAHSGNDVLARLPAWLPGVGGIVTAESAAFGLSAALGLVAAVLAVVPLSLLLDAADVADALPGALAATGTALAAALNLVPALGRTFTAIREAQTMRGWRPRGPRSWAQVLVPAALTAVEDAVQLAEAMEARAYGAGRRRTRLPGSGWTAFDATVVAGAAAAAGAFAGARLLGLVADWYPYPELTAPPVQPALVAAVLLLAIPLLRRWSRQPSTG
jgi:energy-coupling factor transport system permease protein